MPQAKKIQLKPGLLIWLLAGALVVLAAQPAAAVQSVTLRWAPSASPNVRGYTIYYGTASQNYTGSVTVSGGSTSATIWGLTGGTTYFFAAQSFKNAQEQSALSTELAYTLPPDATNQPPMLTAQLVSQSFIAGQNATFHMAGIGTGPLNYKWNFNGNPLAGATNAVLALTNLTADQAGTYTVTVTDDVGVTNSNPATLTLHTAAAAQAAATLTPVSGLAATVDGGSQYALDVSGLAGSTYVVQASTNLVNWISVQTNLAPFTFIDTNVNQFNQRFYRAVQQP